MVLLKQHQLHQKLNEELKFIFFYFLEQILDCKSMSVVSFMQQWSDSNYFYKLTM